METKEKEIICLDKLETVRGSQTEEQYYKEYEELGLLDTEEHLLKSADAGIAVTEHYGSGNISLGRLETE